MKFSAAILAGGQSRRMGCDKAFLDWKGRPLLAHQIRTIQRLRPAELFISGRPEVDYSSFGCPVICDCFVDCGPLAGIEQALGAARFPMVLVLAVDLPGMTSAFLRKLAWDCTQYEGAIPVLDGRFEPTAAFYPKGAHALALALLQQGLTPACQFAEQCVAARLLHLHPVSEPCRRCFFNWNEPNDLFDTRLCASSCLHI